MNLFQAILFGIIQGLTEFLPISSTAHLTIAAKLLHVIPAMSDNQWTAFMAVIQLGTMLAVLIYFWKDVWEILFAFFKENVGKGKVKYPQQSLNSRLGWLIIVGSIPVGVIGLSLKKIIEGALTKDLYIIAASMVGLAILLAIAEKIASFKKDIKAITVKDSFLIGVAQCFALIPGSSRSGTTITAGLFLGLKRETAARFSFLLSLPAVFASGFLELWEARKFIDPSMTVHIIAATIFAFVFGYWSIGLLLKFLRTKTTFVFVYYRIALGVLILVLILTHVILP
ncbi:MAG: undecaprenyl-diphosphatase UppP [Ignavibacteriaceae bacterium]